MKNFARKVLILLDIGGGSLGLIMVIRSINFSAPVTYILVYIIFLTIYLFCIISGLLLIKNNFWALVSNKVIWSLQIISINVHFIVFRFFIGSMIGVWWKLPDNKLF
jgi:hypothetical protein